MGGSKKQTTTTVQQSNNKPQPYADANFSKANTAAGKLFDNDAAWKPFEGSTVVDQSADTLKSMDMMRDAAGKGVWGLPQAQQHASGVIEKGGVDSALTGQYGDMQGGALGDFASGKMLNEGNPYLEQALSKGADDIQGRLGEVAAANGQYGSGTHQGLLSESLSNHFNNGRLQNYQQGVNNMMSAKGMQKGMLDSQIGAEMQGDQLALGAGQGLPSLYDASLRPAATLGQVGAEVEGYQGQILQDQIDKYYANRDIEKNKINYLNAVAGGSGQFGSSTQTAQGPSQQTPWWQTAAGGALALGGLF
ncbi:MAG: hypothetical protein N4A65_00345 [Cohaesibacter sp.]|jgi:hypothetical protein|nr:hypothetical protein [Cohaesibacter sp.]